jgi:glucose-1-phosphate cytidylyltransferase
MSDVNSVVPDRADIPVVILCGGMGTRIREASEKLPKPLIEIGGKPILWHIMKIYAANGFRRFVLPLGYKGDQIRDFFLTYGDQGRDVTVNLAGDRSPQWYGERKTEDWEVTLVSTVTGVHPTSRFGEMHVSGQRVSEFNEKPTMADGWVSGGFFAHKREMVDRYLDDDPDLLLEKKPMQTLATDGELGVFTHEGFWMGMDTYRDWVELNGLWDKGDAAWKVWA